MSSNGVSSQQETSKVVPQRDSASDDRILGVRVAEGEVVVYSVAASLVDDYSVFCGSDEYQLLDLGDRVPDWIEERELLVQDSEKQSFGLKNADPATSRVGTNYSEAWTLEGETTYFLECAREATAVLAVYRGQTGEKLSVLADRTYVASGYFGAHRCRGRLLVELFDAQGRRIGEHQQVIEPNFKGGQKLSGYQPIELKFRTPHEAFFATFSIEYTESVHLGPKNKNYLFFTCCSLRLLSADSLERVLFRGNGKAVRETLQSGKLRVAGARIDLNRLNQTNPSIRLEPREGRRGRPLTVYTPPQVANRKISALRGNIAEFVANDTIDVAELFVDGNHVQRRQSTDGRFQFVVPDKYFDGEIHYIQIKDAYCIATLAEEYHAFPSTVTPWNVLRNGNALPAVGQLGPAAGLRYKNLLRHLDEISTGAAPSWVLQHLSWLHGTLERGFEGLTRFQPLVFPVHESPDVSIVIPVHNKFNVTYYCLCALLFAKNRATFEVIVVDDASTDDTQSLIEIVQGVVCVRNETNQGFVRSCNRGAEHARGKYVVMLNNDTEPTVGWLDELIAATNLYPNVGLAGSRLLYPDGTLQEAGGIVWGNGDPWNYGRKGNPADPRFTYTRQADYVSGASILLPLSVWKDVGGFSDEFYPAYFEDTDLAFKVRAVGYKTLYAAQSVVYHFEGASNGTSVASGTKKYQEANRPKFKRKWSRAYQSHRSEPSEPDLEKDRGIRGRALFIDHRTPQPDNDAGSYALIQEMKLVQALGYKVTFLPQNLGYMGKYTDELNRMGIETLYAPFYFSLHEVLERRGSEFDVVYVTRYTVAQQVFELVRRHAARAKILFCNADLHFLRELRLGMAHKDNALIDKAMKTRDEELAIMRQADVTLSYNEVEHAVIASHNLNNSTVAKAPWVVETSETVAPFEERKGLAFLGGFNHPPNNEAVEYFVAFVMPILRRSMPGVRFHIYGSAMTDRLKKLERDDVICAGYVQNLADVFQKHRVFVAPLQTGAGIKGKVLAAMAAGIPSVLSSIAAEGTNARDEYDCLIAQSPDDWARSITRLYGDPELWKKVSDASRAFAKKEYSFEKGVRLMRDAFEAAGIYVDADYANARTQ